MTTIMDAVREMTQRELTERVDCMASAVFAWIKEHEARYDGEPVGAEEAQAIDGLYRAVGLPGPFNSPKRTKTPTTR